MQSPRRLEGGPLTVPLRFPSRTPGDSTAVRLSAPGAVRHDVANQVAHVVLQISDDVLDDFSHRDHAHDLARVQHFYGAVTLGHDTDQYVVVDDQHRPDPVVAHLAQGFDDHVAGTNMDQGATLLGQSVSDCVHRVPLVSPVLARLSGTH